MPEQKFKQTCKCENCGNEAEMLITCTLEEGEKVVPPAENENPVGDAETKKIVMGHGICSHCGNEADIWVDVE